MPKPKHQPFLCTTQSHNITPRVIAAAVMSRIDSQLKEPARFLGPDYAKGIHVSNMPVLLSVRDAAALYGFLHSIGLNPGDISHSVEADVSFLFQGLN